MGEPYIRNIDWDNQKILNMRKPQIIPTTIMLAAAIDGAFASNIYKYMLPDNIYTRSDCAQSPINCTKTTTSQTCQISRPYYTQSDVQIYRIYTGLAIAAL